MTDFSEPSELALPFVTAIAREYGGTIEALEDSAQSEMDRVAARLVGVPHETMILRGGVWQALQESIQKTSADLIVFGTHDTKLDFSNFSNKQSRDADQALAAATRSYR